jgi:hypothetical protein
MSLDEHADDALAFIAKISNGRWQESKFNRYTDPILVTAICASF